MNETPDFLVKALQSLVPKAEFISYGGKLELLDWKDERPKPTDKQINDKVAELQADYDALQYQRDRAEQYPSITDVVVALAEKQEGDDTMWQEITAQRAKVKADNPKPS